MPVCMVCEQTRGLLEMKDGKCRSCRERDALEKEREKEEEERQWLASNRKAGVSDKILDEAAKSILLTTGSDIPQRDVESIVEIVASEVAISTNIFKDIANNWRDAIGGRSETVQKTLRDARENCFLELRREAYRASADAVIGVRLSYDEATVAGGTGGGILFVAAVGTAVRLVKR